MHNHNNRKNNFILVYSALLPSLSTISPVFPSAYVRQTRYSPTFSSCIGNYSIKHAPQNPFRSNRKDRSSRHHPRSIVQLLFSSEKWRHDPEWRQVLTKVFHQKQIQSKKLTNQKTADANCLSLDKAKAGYLVDFSKHHESLPQERQQFALLRLPEGSFDIIHMLTPTTLGSEQVSSSFLLFMGFFWVAADNARAWNFLSKCFYYCFPVDVLQ